jgi:hypothetical protein
MYASAMFVQEGSPRNIHEIAVSGLSFKKRDAAEFLEPIMVCPRRIFRRIWMNIAIASAEASTALICLTA